MDEKISALTGYTTPLDADVLPVVDTANTTTKKTTWANIKATLKTYLDTLYQPLDSDLTTIASLTATTDNFLVSVSSAWASRTPTQVKTTLSLNNVDNTSDATKNSATATLTNKSVPPRVVTTTDDATAVIDVALTDDYQLSAIANNTAFSFTGSPADGQRFVIRYKDAGVSKTLTWTGFVAIGVTLPSATTASTWGYVGVK
jgi:hypothetical protein